MRYNGPDEQTLTRRSLLLAGGGLGVFAGLSSRLYYLQVTRAEDFKVLSENNRFNYNILSPSRGRILDRYGEALALNRQNYQVMLIPEQVEDLDLTLSELSDVLELSNDRIEDIKSDIRRSPKFIPVMLKDHMEWKTFSQINMRTPDLPGINPQVGERRAYPHGGLFSHVLGYVGMAGPDDIETDPDPVLLRQPDFRIGKTGVESTVDTALRGKSGRLKVEVNAVGRIVREWPNESDMPDPGKDVWLTLDANLQQYAAELFGDNSGGVAVIDIMTGELRTLLSMPTFDGNLFVSGLTQADMDRMNSDEKRPQFNKVIGGGYPPASTFKMIVALTALKHGLVDPDEFVYCSGKTRLGNRLFHCWKRSGHGSVNLTQSIQYSCDCYYYEMARRTDISLIKQTALEFGLGQKYDLGIAGQTTGIVPDPQWKLGRVGVGWQQGDSFNAAIGQGFVLVTPLQLAVMTARLANGALAVSPRLIIGDNYDQSAPLDVDPEHLAAVRNAMWSVCHVPGGTAYRADPLGFGDVQMAGKTGTGQVRGISMSERAQGVLGNDELPWKYRDHKIFVAYAPYDKPRFAVGTIVEHGGATPSIAADISRSLLTRVLERDGIQKKSETKSAGTPL